ncbi:hypothetical protein [Paenibacillus sp. P46E]|uniref:hypothetical protein n=1 Tax=Paenibacillus sp. P46E TaxID=1349436 RepID=UPI00093DE499|nr:hypothetical protein [Paenibacillus sp. P46E]OKP97683.1 hypothetical protein A3849_14350 [Paenibacillus sp. P46E]
MNWYYLIASVLAFVVGLAHSILGEVLIFRRMRHNGFIPTNGGNVLSEAFVRIIWSTWHALTAFGWGMSLILLWLARNTSLNGTFTVLADSVAVSMLIGAILILIGTKGKHPGWVGLLGVAVLIFLGGTA